MTDYTIDIRQRRQATFPSELLRQLGMEVGDAFEVKVRGKKAVLRPKKQIALTALKEIQKAFSQAKISEREMQNEISKTRSAEK